MWDTWLRCLGWEDTPEKGKAYPLQYSGLENSVDFIVYGVTKNWTQLSNFHFTSILFITSERFNSYTTRACQAFHLTTSDEILTVRIPVSDSGPKFQF